MITLEEKRENFRRWWKKYIKNYSKEFILEHLDGIAETIFNSVLNCDIKIFDIDQWHYPSKGEYPKENGEYLFLVEAFSNIYRVVGNYEVLKNQRLWSAQIADEWELIAWMPLPEVPKEVEK